MRRLTILTTAALCLAALIATAARADYGIRSFDIQIPAKAPSDLTETSTYASGGEFTQAAGHPYSIVTHLEWNNHPDPQSTPPNAPSPDGDIKSTDVELPPGLVGNPVAIPHCTAAQLAGAGPLPTSDPALCPAGSQVGVIHLDMNTSRFYEQAGSSTTGSSTTFPIYNMVAPAGLPARFGFDVGKVLVYFDAGLTNDGGYRLTLGTHNAPQALRIVGADVTFWGVPADEAHFLQRCTTVFPGLEGDRTHARCRDETEKQGDREIYIGPRPAGVGRAAFLRMPTSCTAPEEGEKWSLTSDSWESPGILSPASIHNHLPPYLPGGAPGPQQGTSECQRVPFNPSFTAQPTQLQGASATGLDIGLDFPKDGLLNPDGIAQSDLNKAVVTLPEGMQINPSQAEGLGVCGPEEYQAASLDSYGCPSTAKIGTVEVKTPLLEETVPGNVYVAKPFDNPSKSLIALYIVLREPGRGIAVKLAGKVEPDPETGQIVATFEDLPQLPFESFAFRFREGPRAPLITPRTCGAYTTNADFYPWARPEEPVHTTSSFQVTAGPGGGPCPQGDVAPFHPGFTAGTRNNAAGAYSPFLMRLTRADGEQDLTKFSSTLPPGLVARIAGVRKCPESWLALAPQKTGTEERESPSCPADSQIGTILAGAGVGSSLVYVPGRLYLAGPYNGAPLSAVAIVPAVAGPFDVGNVVTRVALSLDPRTAEVHVDGERSDPIPHILAGIPLSVREIRVNADRPQFTLNPTNCNPSQVGATLWGSNLDLLSPADDRPVSLDSRFQAASCASLGFAPKLALALHGSTTRRGGHPALHAVYRPRKGDANLKGLVVRLPHSAFLDQAHIRTICTRVQFAANGGNGAGCPKGAVYGHVKATTPLLDRPLEGPVYLRSSNHNLPDFVAALHGVVDIEAAARIDSVHGGIRATFTGLPDAPLSEVVVDMQGAKKGLIVNSRNICGSVNRANVEFDGHNGKVSRAKPQLKPDCAKAHRRGRARRR